MNQGVIFNLQRYSIHDGPGIRTTVFLKGCPLRCAWCSNPESQDFQPEVAHRDTLCDQCGKCIIVCDVQAISINRNGVHIDRELCYRCFKCVQACIPGAISVLGRHVSVNEVFQVVKKDIQYYQNSGGGVTCSGGEPLSQSAFVARLFQSCREAGIHTALETSGYADPSSLEQIIPYTSLVLFDIKHADPVAHLKWTKMSNIQIIDNLKLIADKGTSIFIRVPLIPGVNDSDEELTAMTDIVSGILKEPVIQLLPYHRYGVNKYQNLDRRYELNGLARPGEGDIQRSKKTIESVGIKCEIIQ